MENNKRPFGDNPIIRRKQNYSTITTSEAIVREHRRRWTEKVSSIPNYATGTSVDREIKRIDRKLMRVTILWKLRRLINRIDWNVMIEWICWGLVILAMIAISGVIFFSPTDWRRLW